jgi:EAL domain-containing protein (putative c-di-GMP-specific phosphodiesterase class I)/GGDEF domain-containing protein
MYAEVIPYRDRIQDLRKALRDHGSLGLLLIDVSDLTQVEHDYGSDAFEKVLSMATELVLELKGNEVRTADIVALNDKGGDAFLVFLSPKRGDREGRTRVSDLKSAAQRVQDHLNKRLARLASPYIRGRRRVTVGFSVVFSNPLVMDERLVARLVEEAWECVRIERMQLEFNNRCQVQELLLGDHVRTVFQPVVDLRARSLLGYEALSRGPAGTEHSAPLNMFAAAAQSDLVFELDRHCRQKALQSASRSLPADAKLFLNVFPSSMWDPDFHGASLIEMLGGLGLGPDRIVLEISEKYAIENYTLFVEALKNFTDVGFQVAVDDIGAGYSGLEKIAHLTPRYLKLDMQLVRDIDASYIRREMTRAVKAFADKMEASIIAEGIEREGELAVVAEMGIEFGQGWLLGRPAETFAAPAGSRAASTPETKTS